MSLTARIDINAIIAQGATANLGVHNAESKITNSVTYSHGTGNGQATKCYAAARSLAASASEELDLAGSLVDPLGSVVSFATVKAIVIRANASNTNNVVVGGAAANAFAGPFGDVTDKISIPPGGEFVIAHNKAGWAVVAGTADLLKIANSAAGSAVQYDIIIVGT